MNVENLVLTGSEAIQGIGNSLNNVLVGNAANNKLRGKSGRDTRVGGLGKDSLAGGLDDDTFVFKSIADSGVTLVPATGSLIFRLVIELICR